MTAIVRNPDLVVEEVSDLIRITTGPDDVQWTIQVRGPTKDGGFGVWRPGSYCRTKAGLVQSITERLRYDAITKEPDIVAAIERYVAAGLAALAELPEDYPAGMGTGK